MNGETKEVHDHAHTWEVVKFNDEFIGKTNEIDGHFHDVSLPVGFASGDVMRTSINEGHSHEIVFQDAKAFAVGSRRGPRDGSGPDGGTDECPEKDKFQDDEIYGPDGSDEEEDEKKRLKQKVDEDGLVEERNAKFQGKYTDAKWDFRMSEYSLEQLRRAVPASMRAWADARGKNKSDYKLPYKEPNGMINVNGVRNALARASQVKGVPQESISSAVAELQKVLAGAKKAGFACGEEEDKKKFSADLKAIADRLREKYANDPNIVVLDNRVLVKNQHLFQVGTWNGVPVGQGMINEMVANYKALENSFLPSITAGHDREIHNALEGELSLGWVHNPRPAFPYMDGDLEFPLDFFDKYVDPGKLRFKSIEVMEDFHRNGKDYGTVLTSLALLGVNPPALNDLGPVVRPFADQGKDVIRISFDNGGEEGMAAEEVKKFEDEIAKLKAENAKLKKFEAENVDLKKAKEDAETQATHFSAQLRAKDAQMAADKLKGEGKLLPADEDSFKFFYLTLDGENKLTFSQKDGSEMKRSQVEMFMDIMNSAKPKVDLDSETGDKGERTPNVPDPDASQSDDEPTSAAPKSLEGHKKFTEKARKHGYKFSGVKEHEAALKLQAESSGKLNYEDALAQVYASQSEE